MKICPRCRLEYPEDALFCAECGASLSEGPAIPATPAAPATDGFAIPVPPAATFSESVPASAEQPVYAAPPREIYGEPPALPILIENNTPFTRQTLRDFYKKFKIIGLIFCIAGAFFLLINIILSMTGPAFNDAPFAAFGFIFIALGIFYFLLTNLYVKKNVMITDFTYQIYRFDEQYIHSYGFEQNRKFDETHIGYEKISKVRQNQTYIFIYFGLQVWIISRHTFTKGTEEELKELLRAKCGPKIARFPKK